MIIGLEVRLGRLEAVAVADSRPAKHWASCQVTVELQLECLGCWSWWRACLRRAACPACRAFPSTCLPGLCSSFAHWHQAAYLPYDLAFDGMPCWKVDRQVDRASSVRPGPAASPRHSATTLAYSDEAWEHWPVHRLLRQRLCLRIYQMEWSPACQVDTDLVRPACRDTGSQETDQPAGEVTVI